MKTLLVSTFLLVTASVFGALAPATGGHLTDYANWFGPEFNVASDANYVGLPYPRNNVPDAVSMDIAGIRDWSGWSPNWSPGIGDPITGLDHGLVVEAVFLGESAGWWDDWGYRLNGVDYLLADGVQAKGGRTRQFGDYTSFTLYEGDTLDFFITGSGIKRQDSAITVNGSLGGKYYVFDKTLNTPAAATKQSYYGTLTPLSSVRGPAFLGNEDGTLPFTVVAFEDMNIPSGKSDKDYNDFLFAFRTGYDTPCCIPVPEASTYGVWAATALLGLAAGRRKRKRD